MKKTAAYKHVLHPMKKQKAKPIFSPSSLVIILSSIILLLYVSFSRMHTTPRQEVVGTTTMNPYHIQNTQIDEDLLDIEKAFRIADNALRKTLVSQTEDLDL